ncbi:hypothetical protein ACX40Y_16045 [Sphingomonas sp. RS6]
MPMPKPSQPRTESGHPLGAFLARVASLGTHALGYFLWALLRLIYRGEPKLAAMFAGIGALLAVTVWTVAT